MSYVVQASPYTKIFMPEWEAKCINDPTLIEASAPGLFTVRIQRPIGGLVLEHLKPRHVTTLLPRLTTMPDGSKAVMRKVEEDEVSPLLQWLTGPTSEETDIWGVVNIEIGTQFEDAMTELIALTLQGGTEAQQAEVLKRQIAIQRDVAKSMAVRIAEARKVADDRVKRALRITHNNLIKSWENLRGQNLGTYEPSTQETLGYRIIKAEIDRRQAAQQKINREMVESVARVSNLE
jgi:hypothetical protein